MRISPFCCPWTSASSPFLVVADALAASSFTGGAIGKGMSCSDDLSSPAPAQAGPPCQDQAESSATSTSRSYRCFGQVNSQLSQASVLTESAGSISQLPAMHPKHAASSLPTHPSGNGSRVSHTAAYTCCGSKCTRKCVSSHLPGFWL